MKDLLIVILVCAILVVLILIQGLDVMQTASTPAKQLLCTTKIACNPHKSTVSPKGVCMPGGTCTRG